MHAEALSARAVLNQTVVDTQVAPVVHHRIVDRRLRRHHKGDSHRLTAFGGIAAMSLDALSSVAYGPEAIVLGLIVAGTAAVTWTVPIALAIAGLLLVLVVSYRQVIAVHPDGGGAYAVAKKDLGRWPALLAAASLLVDYVLTVAVSLAAGAASLASVFPPLAHHLLALTLAGLAVLVDAAVRAGRRRARSAWLAAAVAVVVTFGAWPRWWSSGTGLLQGGLIWYAPDTSFGTGDNPKYVEYHWHGLQFIAGNLYVLAGGALFIVALVTAAQTLRRRPGLRAQSART